MRRALEWLHAPADARTAAALRIGLCALWLFILWDVYPARELLLGRDGLLGTSEGSPVEPVPVLGWLWTHDRSWELNAWLWSSVAVALAGLVGWRARLTVPLTYLAMLLFQERNPYALSGADAVMRQVGLWVALLDTSAAWSWDAWRRARRGEPPRQEVVGWPVRAIQLQMVAIYVAAVGLKLAAAEWRDGSAVYYALSAPLLPNQLGVALRGWRPMLAPLTYASLVAEALFPALVFFRRTRRAALALGVALHAGIDLVFSLRSFAFAMFLGYLAFLERDDWRGRGGRSR